MWRPLVSRAKVSYPYPYALTLTPTSTPSPLPLPLPLHPYLYLYPYPLSYRAGMSVSRSYLPGESRELICRKAVCVVVSDPPRGRIGGAGRT